MENFAIIENFLHLCDLRNEKPIPACINAGIGKEFFTHLKKGHAPSVQKVQMLAQYFGVTTSELIGEIPIGHFAGVGNMASTTSTGPPGLTPEELELLAAYRRADEDDKTAVRLILKKYAKKASTGAADVG